MEESKEEPPKDNVYGNISDVINMIGGFGRFQRVLIGCFCIMLIPSTLSVLIMYFTALSPPWRCVKTNSSTCVRNGTFPSTDNSRCSMRRADWAYTIPPSYSIITQFDLSCGKEWAAHLTTSIFFVGWGFGALVLGWISDNYGRKIVLFPSYFVIMFVGFLASFSPNVTILIIARFVIGFCIPGAPIQCMVMISEFVSTRYRPHAVVILWFFFSLYLCLLSLKAYFIREWKTLFLVCSVPYVFIMAFYRFIPESIRWLHLHGKIIELKYEFDRMGRWNSKENIVQNISIIPLPITDKKCKSIILDLFRTRKMAGSSLVQGFGWLVNGSVYYGLSLAASDLGGSVYRNFALLSAVETPALILTTYLCNRIGRKRTTSGAMVAGGIACLIAGFIPASPARIVIGILGKCSITISFSSIYTWSLELYSTQLRGEGIGFLQVMARIGAAASPWIAKGLKVIHPAVPFAVMGSLSLVAALSLLVLPETVGKPTMEVEVNESEEDELKDDCKLMT